MHTRSPVNTKASRSCIWPSHIRADSVRLHLPGPHSERRVALQEALSSVATEAAGAGAAIRGTAGAHSHPPDAVGEQDARRQNEETEEAQHSIYQTDRNFRERQPKLAPKKIGYKPSGIVMLWLRLIPAPQDCASPSRRANKSGDFLAAP